MQKMQNICGVVLVFKTTTFGTTEKQICPYIRSGTVHVKTKNRTLALTMCASPGCRPFPAESLRARPTARRGGACSRGAGRLVVYLVDAASAGTNWRRMRSTRPTRGFHDREHHSHTHSSLLLLLLLLLLLSVSLLLCSSLSSSFSSSSSSTVAELAAGCSGLASSASVSGSSPPCRLACTRRRSASP